MASLNRLAHALLGLLALLQGQQGAQGTWIIYPRFSIATLLDSLS